MTIILSYSNLFFVQSCDAFAKNNTLFYISINNKKRLGYCIKSVTHLRKSVTHLRKSVTHLRNFHPLNYPTLRALFELFTCTKSNKYKEIIINDIYIPTFSKIKIQKSKKIYSKGIAI